MTCNAMCNAVTPTVTQRMTNAMCSTVQNQSQNQMFCSCGLSAGIPSPKSLHLGACERLGIGAIR